MVPVRGRGYSGAMRRSIMADRSAPNNQDEIVGKDRWGKVFRISGYDLEIVGYWTVEHVAVQDFDSFLPMVDEAFVSFWNVKLTYYE
jgi:hypothetical protein